MEYFYFEQEPSLCRASFAITHLGQLQSSENSLWLDANSFYQQPTYQEAALGELIAKRELRAVNRAHPRWRELCQQQKPQPPFTVNLLACGDVGSTLLIGLKLLAQNTIRKIGIYDINPALCQRWEFELNQICAPSAELTSPVVSIITKDQLFD